MVGLRMVSGGVGEVGKADGGMGGMGIKAKAAVIQMSEAAKARVKELLEEDESGAKGLRVGIKKGGCSGYEYDISLTQGAKQYDEVVEVDGVKVYVDGTAVMHVLGSELDFYSDTITAEFRFRNPNASSTCGCGISFAI